MIIVDDFIGEEESNRIVDLLNNVKFSLHKTTTYGDDVQLVHPVVVRPEEVTDNQNPVVSEYAALLKHLFEKFLYKAGIFCNYDILRMSINATVKIDVEESMIHKDHEYPHKQLIICLNDGYKGGATRIYDDNDVMIDRIESKRYRGYMFDSCRHSAEYPESGIRIVAVYTFNME